MKKPFKALLFCVLTSLLVLTSCQTKKKLIYFQEEVDGAAHTNYTPTLKTDDFLSIIVSGEDPLTVVPFNLPPAEGVNRATNSGYTQGNPAPLGYLIDGDGNVQLPTLGTIHLAGLNRMEAVALIEEKLAIYINNPVVNLQILNFKVTILGEVAKPGTFKIPNERITILEAIGLAGDLKITGVRKNVLVIRDNDGTKEEFRVDLTDTKLFNSPVYYLQQNDVVYIEPNVTSRANSTIWKTTGGVFISLTSLIIGTITLITK